LSVAFIQGSLCVHPFGAVRVRPAIFKSRAPNISAAAVGNHPRSPQGRRGISAWRARGEGGMMASTQKDARAWNSEFHLEQ
jgi:hypothetical protein